MGVLSLNPQEVIDNAEVVSCDALLNKACLVLAQTESNKDRDTQLRSGTNGWVKADFTLS